MENNPSLNFRNQEPRDLPPNELVQTLLQSGIMPTVQLNPAQQQDDTMQHFQQISSLDAHCRDSFAEQKAKVQQLSETVARHETKLDTLLQDTAVLKSCTDQHLAQKTDLLEFEIRLRDELADQTKTLNDKFSKDVTSQSDVLNEKLSKLSDKVDNHFKWFIGGFAATAATLCIAMYTLLVKTENDLIADIEVNKTKIAEVHKEMRSNHEDISKQLTEIRQMLQEKQSTASIK